MSRIDPLRRLYNSLSEQLSKDDERSLRNLLRDKQLTTRDLEHLNSPAEILIKLEESGHISKTDFVLLKELLKAIKRLPLVAEVERVEEELQESNESKIKSTDLRQDIKHDQFTNSAASTSMKSTHDDKDVILKCQETLRKEYKRLSHILPLPWLDGADSRLKLEDIYTELDLQSGDGPTKIVRREDIFSCSADDENPKRILIEGDPGYGKSTFCKMIAYDWAKGKTEYLCNFKLLFLLQLKDVQEYHRKNSEKHNLKDLIFDLVLRDVKEKETLWSFIENNQSQVCFIFDGLDEVSSSNLPVYFKQMVQQKWPLLPDCHVIVTSRIIRDVDSMYMYDRKLSIKGFDKLKAELFVKNYLRCHNSTDKARTESYAFRFIQELRGSRSRLILTSLMQSPLNALLLCEIWKQNRKVPYFITEIYEAIVEYMVKRYCENTKNHTFNDTEKKQTLLFLGKKSHEGLLSGRGQVFLSDNEIKKQPHILKLGFLSKLSTSLQGYSFPHITYQEYFAALYIADMCSTNPSKFAESIDVSVFSKRKCSDLILVFVAGLLKEKQSKMFEVWYRKIDISINAFDPIFILQESDFVTTEIISLCAKVLPSSLYINIATLESPNNKRRLEIIKLLLQCSDIRSDTVCIQVSASSSNARQIYSSCRVYLKANSKKIGVQLKIDCDLSLSKSAVNHHLNQLALVSYPHTDDVVSLHIRSYGDIDLFRSIQEILVVFPKFTAKKHVITGLPFRLNVLDVVLLKLNDACSLHSVSLEFDEHMDTYRFGIPRTRLLQIASKVGKFKIYCNVHDFDIVTFKEKLECFTSGTGDRVALNIKLTCHFRIEAIQTYIEHILDRMTSVNIDELILELLSHSKLDERKICSQIAAIMKRVSSISARTLTIKGFPVESLELIEKVHEHLSGSKSLKSIRVVFAESSERYKVHIDAKFGKFNISYENPFIDFDLVSFHQLLSQYASLNHTTVILNVRVTCLGSVICMSNMYDIIRRMESIPIDNMSFEFSEYAMKDLKDVCSRLIGLVHALSLISARELVIVGLPILIGNEEFIAKIHKVIVTNKPSGSVRIEFKEESSNKWQEKLKITAKIGLLESSFKMNSLNFDLSRLQRLLSILAYHSRVSFDITIKCDLRQNDVGSYVKNLLSGFKYVDIHILSLLVFGYANSETKDIHLYIKNFISGFGDISAEQLYISGFSDEYEQINFITLLFQRLHNNISIKKVSIGFKVQPPPEPSKGKTIKITANFGKFRICYTSHHLKFKLQSLYQSLSHQASLKNEKVTLYVNIYCDFNDRALDSYIKDITVNMNEVDITLATFNFFNFACGIAHHIQNIITNIAQVKIQTLLVVGIPFSDLDVLTTVSEPFTKLIPNTACRFLSGPTCPAYCKLNLLQHSSVVAYCKTLQIKLRICKASCDLVNFALRFLEICSVDERDVKVDAHISYDGNRRQTDFSIQYLLPGNKSLRFNKLFFLDRCNYNKLSVEGRNTIDVLKTVVSVNTKIILYENCPAIDLEFAKSVLDIMLRSQSSTVVISFREQMNRSRILDKIKSFESDGLVIHALELTNRRETVLGKHVKSWLSGKEVKLTFATGRSLNSNFPRDDIKTDTSRFKERDDFPVVLLNQWGIGSDGKTTGQNQTKAVTLSLLCQHISVLAHLKSVSILDSEVIPEENIERHLTEIMTKDSLRLICFMSCNLNKIVRFVIDCIKKTDKMRKNPLRIAICHALDSKNISMLRVSLETEGFVHRTYTHTSPSVGNGTGWRGKRVEIILMPCKKDNENHDIEQYPFVGSELSWCVFNNMQNQ